MQHHRKALLHCSVWVAAGVVGVLAVLYAKLIAWMQSLYFDFFRDHALIVTLLTPLGFVAATSLVKLLAPDAKGSGIPQVLQAIEISKGHGAETDIWTHRLVSLWTAGVKIVSSTIGTLAGASIGREGPTVQIAASGFAAMGRAARRFYPDVDFSSFVTAGAAAGVAAAFNTPLAGITFALEEIAEGAFGPFKQIVILSVVLAGITAQGVAGNYLYFGHPEIVSSDLPIMLLQALPIGVIGGLAGGVFAWILGNPSRIPLPKSWWLRSLIAGVLCSLIGYFNSGDTAGSGYEFTRRFLDGPANETIHLFFPFWKLLTTIFSYHSGMAGGIFAPCLSIGAGIGMTFATLAHFNTLKACALVGMVAFFSGAVQAPLTAVVIVMEMTDQHTLILPFLVAAFLAQGLGRLLMPTPLYRHIANAGMAHHHQSHSA